MRCVDLDLDVIRETDGRIWVDDEDEFAEHQLTLGYPSEVIESAVASATDVLATMTAGAAPFDGSAGRWIAKLRELGA